MAITTNDIHGAADNIAADGSTPTLASVRKALGGGSFTTISEAMKEWKAKHQAQIATTPIREAAPASVSEKLNVLGSEIWASAQEMANAKLQSEREAMKLEMQSKDEERDEAIDLADQLTIEVEQKQATIQEQQTALAKTEMEKLEIASRLENERVARQEVERKCEVIDAAMTEVRRQVEDFKELRTEASTTAKKLGSAESNLSSVVDRLDLAQSELEKTRGIISEKDALISELKIQAAKVESKLSDALGRLDQVQIEFEKTRGIVSEKDALIAELKIQRADALAQVT